MAVEEVGCDKEGWKRGERMIGRERWMEGRKGKGKLRCPYPQKFSKVGVAYAVKTTVLHYITLQKLLSVR